METRGFQCVFRDGFLANPRESGCRTEKPRKTNKKITIKRQKDQLISRSQAQYFPQAQGGETGAITTREIRTGRKTGIGNPQEKKENGHAESFQQ
jgi:hypothetical protein